MDAVMAVAVPVRGHCYAIAGHSGRCGRSSVLPCVPFTAFTPLIPFLFFISTPPYSNEPPCSRGELIVARRVADKHGIMAAGYARKIGRAFGRRIALPRRAHFGDFDLEREARSRPARRRAGRRRRRREGRRWPTSAASGSRGRASPPSTSILSSSRASSAIRPRLTARRRRSAGSSWPCSAISASMPPMVRSDAGGRGRLRRVALVDREAAGRGAPRRRRVATCAVAFDPKMRMAC